MKTLLQPRYRMSIALAFSLAVAAALAQAPDDLDASWGEQGTASSNALFMDAAMLAPDGTLHAVVTRGGGFEIVLFDERGRLRKDFGDEGFFMPRAAPFSSFVHVVTLLRDGRYVAVHGFLDAFPHVPYYLSRHLPDGRPDPTFGPDGVVVLPATEERVGSTRLLTVATDGTIYFVRTKLQFFHDAPPFVREDTTWLVRADARGRIVSEFARSGETSPGSLVLQRRYQALAVQRDGKLLAAVAGDDALTVLRFDANDALDATFGIGGAAVARNGGRLTTYAMDLAPDGGITVVGAGESSGRPAIVAARFDDAGSLDATFGNAGLAVVAVGVAGEAIDNAFVARTADGRLVIAAALSRKLPDSAFRYAGVVRLHANGRPDDRFAGAGKSSVWTAGGFVPVALHVRPDGRIVLAGTKRQALDPAAGTRDVVLQLRGGDDATPRPLAEARAVEYLHRGFLHFFVTADPAEIATMDTTPSAWIRTGDTFRVWSEPAPSLVPTCRFWSDQAFAPRSSHFYTPYAAECASLRAASGPWKYEGDAFHLRLPDLSVQGSPCPADTQPLYRAYNNGLTGAPNHRYVVASATLDAMIGQGYAFEGDAHSRIFACVPRQ